MGIFQPAKTQHKTLNMRCRAGLRQSAAALLLTMLAALPVKALDLAEENHDGRRYLIAMPESPSGLVFLFHGSRGSADFALRDTVQDILDPLFAAGFGIVASESADRTNVRRWLNQPADTDGNVDLAFMLGLHTHLIGSTPITEETPVFTMGMSNGGGFATLFGIVAKAEGRPVAAIANYMGPLPASGRALVRQGVQVPPLFMVLAENDGLVNNDNILKGVAFLKAQGARVDVYTATPVPVTAEAIVPLTDFPLARAQAFVAFLTERGLIDAGGNRLYNKGQALTREMLQDLRPMMDESGFGRQAFNAVLILWAGHRMRSDYADEQIRFFIEARDEATRPSPAP